MVLVNVQCFHLKILTYFQYGPVKVHLLQILIQRQTLSPLTLGQDLTWALAIGLCIYEV